MVDTKELTRRMLEKGFLKEETFTLKDLFEIRDALMVLARFGLEDKELLDETLKYINQKAKE